MLKTLSKPRVSNRMASDGVGCQVVLSYLDSVTNTDTSRSFSRKLAPPLVTLLNSEPETQYVALRNINLIVQKRAGILESEIKVCFELGGVACCLF